MFDVTVLALLVGTLVGFSLRGLMPVEKKPWKPFKVIKGLETYGFDFAVGPDQMVISYIGEDGKVRAVYEVRREELEGRDE